MPGRLMIEIGLAAVLVALALFGVGFVAHHDRARWALVIRASAAAYAVLLIVLVFFPFPLPPWANTLHPHGYVGFPQGWLNVIPFSSIGQTVGLGLEWPAARFLLGNVAAFVPLGVLLPLIWQARSWRFVLGMGIVVSLAIELTQLGLSLLVGYPYRHADIDDVILNACGTTPGYLLFVAASAAYRRVGRRGATARGAVP